MRFGPLIALAIISCIGIGMSIERHGKPREKENAWLTFLAWIIQWGLIFWAII